MTASSSVFRIRSGSFSLFVIENLWERMKIICWLFGTLLLGWRVLAIGGWWAGAIWLFLFGGFQQVHLPITLDFFPDIPWVHIVDLAIAAVSFPGEGCLLLLHMGCVWHSFWDVLSKPHRYSFQLLSHTHGRMDKYMYDFGESTRAKLSSSVRELLKENEKLESCMKLECA